MRLLALVGEEQRARGYLVERRMSNVSLIILSDHKEFREVRKLLQHKIFKVQPQLVGVKPAIDQDHRPNHKRNHRDSLSLHDQSTLR